MTNFQLDSRLANDCIVLKKMNKSQLLLNKNAIVPWFILVPETTETELTDLPQEDQEAILKEINAVSAFVKENFEVTKLNIAAIGLVVSQLHIHVIGRNPSDYCWPNVVWGRDDFEAYTDKTIESIKEKIKLLV